MIPITGIISAIQAGIPLAERFTKLFKKKPKTDVNSVTVDVLKDKIVKLESANDEKPIEWFIKTALTLATVYGVIYIAKHLGVTYNDIITLMGLIK